MFLHFSPSWLRAVYPTFVWRIPSNEKVIYITFDDGPIPDITEFALKTLHEWNAKATFFCIGANVKKHPLVFNKIIEGGHSIGNHTYNHLNGWQSEDELYLQNFQKCTDQLGVETRLFRPPYGRIKRRQAKKLPLSTNVVMWDVLTGDYSSEVKQEKCLRKSIKYAKPGSIVLFHDSLKAARNMQYTLPRFLEHFSNLGYTFEALKMN